MRSLELLDVLASTPGSLSLHAPAPQISLGTPPDPVPVAADPTRLHQILGNLLGLAEHDAAAAYCGEEALELAERHEPQAVLLGLDLPDMDGRTVARRLRERHEPPPLLVAVSGFGGERHFDLSREAGIDHHLVKPVRVDEVLELLRKVPVAKAPG